MFRSRSRSIYNDIGYDDKVYLEDTRTSDFLEA